MIELITDVLLFVCVASVFLPLHSYIFYPLSLFLLTQIFRSFIPRFSADTDFTPRISILIAAYNEEDVLRTTIENFLKSDYPQQNMELLIGSDCSSDSTNDIGRELAQKYPNIIHFFPFTERRGKPAILNDLARKAKGEILIFSDANTLYEPQALQMLVSPYVDEKIGGVCGRLLLHNIAAAEQTGNKERTYWALESFLKNMEGQLGKLIGANGGIYSIRKELFTPMPTNKSITDDLFISLRILVQKKYMLYCKEAKAHEYVAPSAAIEYHRKVRIVSSALFTLTLVPSLLSLKNLLTAYCLISHKILRWFTPLFLIIFALLCIFFSTVPTGLSQETTKTFQILSVLQGIIIALGGIGYALTKQQKSLPIITQITYFISSNIALLHGIIRFLRADDAPFWASTKRS